MKTIFRTPLLLSLIFSYFVLDGSTKRPVVESVKPVRRTWLVVLDLSADRLRVPGQTARDTALIGCAARQFLIAARAQRYLGSVDRFKVVVAPPAGPAGALDSLRENLTVDLGALPVARRRQTPQYVRQVLARVAALYKTAAQGRPANPGADLWHYFRDQFAADLLPNPAFHDSSRVLLLTDGYLTSGRTCRVQGHRYSASYFVGRLARLGEAWPDSLRVGNYGLLPIQFPDRLGATTKLTIAELCPRSEYEGDILAAIWQDWLRTAGLRRPPRLLLRSATVCSLREQIAHSL